MLAQKHYHVLTDILCDDSARFDDSLRRFEEQFSKSEYFPAGWVLQHMIQQNVRNTQTSAHSY
ncbi:MAG: hypothetical protein P4M11_13255 [Candidatus Pacebacteria bacterium]|nr:hypothetical protein [Candidatus Paceibacterota bacterium]